MSGRVVHEGCALQWLRENPLPDDAGVLTSLPSFDEFGAAPSSGSSSSSEDVVETSPSVVAKARCPKSATAL